MAQTFTAASLAPALSEERFQRYYEEAGPDYAAWSPDFNMHFGYFRSGMNPFNRDTMLEQMNREVLDRLRLSTMPFARILDMGCGLGATLRSFACALPLADLHGITLVPWQLEHGRRLNQSSPKPPLSTSPLPTTRTLAFLPRAMTLSALSRAAATALAPARRGLSMRHTACFVLVAASSLQMVSSPAASFADLSRPFSTNYATAG